MSLKARIKAKMGLKQGLATPPPGKVPAKPAPKKKPPKKPLKDRLPPGSKFEAEWDGQIWTGMLVVPINAQDDIALMHTSDSVTRLLYGLDDKYRETLVSKATEPAPVPPAGG